MSVIPAAIAWCIAQAIKTLIDKIYHKKKTFIQALFSSGGMPSSHSATISSIATYIVLTDGIKSNIAGLSIIVTFIVMYDAMNVRQETGKQGKYLNELADYLNEIGRNIEKANFKELVGHTPIQVACGTIVGILTGATYWYYTVFN